MDGGGGIRAGIGLLGLMRSGVLLALLMGFVAMHGLSAPDAGAAVHLPVTGAAVADRHAEPAPGPQVHGAPSAPDPEHGPDHGVLAGCLLALVGLAALVALRSPRLLASRSQPHGGLGGGSCLRAPPPRSVRSRPRISLCVLRV